MLRSGCSLQKYLAIAAILLLGARWSSADQFTFDTPARWQTWQLPSEDWFQDPLGHAGARHCPVTWKPLTHEDRSSPKSVYSVIQCEVS